MKTKTIIQRNPEKKFGPKKTRCLCPRCQKIHHYRIFWTGRKPAPVFCKKCRMIASSYSSSLQNESGKNSRARPKGGAE